MEKNVITRELISVQQVNPIQIFTEKGIDPLLKAITTEVDSFVPDLSTDTSRKEIATMANKVARSKTYLDGLGKGLVSEWKQKAKVVDNSRKKMREYLDDLKAKVRFPLTEWETKEMVRIERLQYKLKQIETLGFPDEELNAAELHTNYLTIESIIITDITFKEFYSEAIIKKQNSISHLETLIEQRKEFEADKLELEQLRKAEAKRKADEQEKQLALEQERIEKEKAEKLELEKAEAVSKAKAEAEEKANRVAEKLERDKQEAIEQKEKAEQQVKEQKEQAERDKVAAAEQATKDSENAARREREKIENENNKLIAQQKKRESDREHARVIHNQIMDVMISQCKVTKEQSQDIIIAIASKTIPHITIQY